MGLLGSSYRTSVLNDFSIVSKAIFYIMKENSGLMAGSYGRVTSESPLPVQINPTELSFSYGSDKKSPEYYDGINWPDDVGSEIPKVQMPASSRGDGSLNISLKYDVYDEYFVRTMDGLLTSSLLGTDSSEMSLMSKSATSLRTLSDYAGKPGYYVLFLWGNISYFGLLTEVNVNYYTFSRWGDPLKATASIEIKKQPLEYEDGVEVSPMESSKIDTLSKTAIKAYTKAADTLNKAALVATQALR